jgi:integrase
MRCDYEIASREGIVRRFSLHQRHGIYYAQLVNPESGKYMTPRSTGVTSRDEAIATVTEWLRDGVPTGRLRTYRPAQEVFDIEKFVGELRHMPLTLDDAARLIAVLRERGFIEGGIAKAGTESELFVDFLRTFWAADGPYIRERKAYGHAITKRHWREAQRIVERRWAQAWQGVRLCEVKRNDLKTFLMRESEEGHAASTINKTYAVVSVALRWAYRNELLPSDPSVGVPRFRGKATKRGILTPEEVGALFELDWHDRRYKTAFAVAVTTGARLGEVLALRPVDVQDDRLRIEHGWNHDDGLKSTKTREVREVPLLPSIRQMLLDLAAENPHGPGPERFIFYGRYPEGPIDAKLTLYHFKKALESIGIDQVMQKERVLTFHGLRHYFATHMADRLDSRKVMQATGHKTEAMLEHYADHRTEEDLGIIRGAAEEEFTRILSFKKAASE